MKRKGEGSTYLRRHKRGSEMDRAMNGEETERRRREGRGRRMYTRSEQGEAESVHNEFEVGE